VDVCLPVASLVHTMICGGARGEHGTRQAEEVLVPHMQTYNVMGRL
jgi:hypothetical protein